MRLLLAFTSCLITSYFITSVAYAQIYNSSVTSSTAGSGRAAIEVGGASFLNPATLVHQRGRQMLFSHSKNEFAAAISENADEVIMPGALGYIQRNFDTPLNTVMHDIRLTLAEPINEQWSFGVTGHYYQVKDDESQRHEANGDIGVLYTPTAALGLALVTYNLVDSNKEIPEAYRLSKKTGLGVNWLFRRSMRFRFDAVSAPNNNFNKLTSMLGYEIYLNKWVLARIGYQDDSFEEKRYATVGLGLDLPRFDLNYAFVSELPRNERDRHSIDLAISF